MAGGDVQEHQLIGAGGVIGPRLFDRIAGVAQRDELHPLHHATVADVEARNDSDFQHQAAAAKALNALAAQGGFQAALLDGVTVKDGMGPAVEAVLELIPYLERQLDAALAAPANERSGLLAVFAEGIAAGTVNAGEARDILLVLVSAGSETTASLLATAVETLARDPGLQEELRQDPARIPAAVEDILRTDGPFQFHYRATPHDTTLGGTSIPANSRVLLMWAAANRPAPDGADEALDDAEGRGPAPHFAFGKGLHFCIGAPVARLEARIALGQLLARTRSIALVPDRPPTQRPSIFIRRHSSLPIVVTPA
jgi:cytochrome P450